MMGAPPLETPSFQVKLIDFDEELSSLRLVGGSGPTIIIELPPFNESEEVPY